MSKWVCALLVALGVSFSAHAGLVEGSYDFTLDALQSDDDYICNDDLGVSSIEGACLSSGTIYFSVTEGDPSTLSVNIVMIPSSNHPNDMQSLFDLWETRYPLVSPGIFNEGYYTFFISGGQVIASIEENWYDNDGQGEALYFSSTDLLSFRSHVAQDVYAYLTPNWQTLAYTVTEVPAPPAIALLVLLGMIPIFKRSKKLAG